DEFLNKLKEKNPLMDVERERPFLYSPSMQISKEEKVVRILSKCAKEITNGKSEIKGGRFDSDAGKFVAKGIPTPVFGPGNIAQAHSENEWVEIEEVARAAEIIAQTVANYNRE
ncbi:M20/M25/M40 family metallo-hydrolase, partial [Candidatus Aerophobetes bacterium]|nr:M20/M25/M40 family metallo-hydrolase [Candidatus Aerophobetes bacterium]